MCEISVIVRENIAAIAFIDDFPLTIIRYMTHVSCLLHLRITENHWESLIGALFGACACLCAEVRGLLVICAWSIRSSCSGDFSTRKSAKMAKLSTDKDAQPNFMRDACVYVLVGLCDHAFSIEEPLPMVTSSNGNIFRVTSPLCGEFTGHRQITLTKASDAELWCFLWSAPERTVE